MKKLQKLLIILVSSLISLAFPITAAFADPPSLSFPLPGSDEEEVEEEESAPPPSFSFPLPEEDVVEVEVEEEEEIVIVVETPPSTSGTGPGVLIYAALPALGLFVRRK